MDSTVLFVLSANYSGSTWLSLLLGSHSRACYVGEINKMFHRDPVPCRLCEERGQECPLFFDVNEKKAQDIHQVVLARTAAQVLVDNSKTLSWSRKFLRASPMQKKYIHLLRDPRGIAHSRQIRGRSTDVADWIAKNYEIRDFLRQHNLDYRVVLYNDLADQTETVVSQLCAWLGLTFEPSQLAYWHTEHHGPGRNGATAAFLEHYIASDAQFYTAMKRTAFHDLRWQDQLDRATKDAIMNDAQVQTFLRDIQVTLTADGLRQVRTHD